MLPDNLKQFADEALRVLDDGHVLLVDVMGDEQAVIDAARVSYGKGTKRVSEDRGLIRYLMRHAHTTPFEMCELKVRIRIPMDAWRQHIRHRTASVNEYSTRYSEAIDAIAQTLPEAWRLQATNNKQGSAGILTTWPEGLEQFRTDTGPDNEYPNGAWLGQNFYGTPGDYLSERETELHSLAREVYDERVNQFGIAREQARKDLPLSNYTEAYWKIDLHNLLHFLKLRLHPHAQLEIRLYAEALAKIIQAWVPTVWEAFEDYVLEAQSYSALEINGLQGMLQQCLNALEINGHVTRDQARDYLEQQAIQESGLKGREMEEFRSKVKGLLRA